MLHSLLSLLISVAPGTVPTAPLQLAISPRGFWEPHDDIAVDSLVLVFPSYLGFAKTPSFPSFNYYGEPLPQPYPTPPAAGPPSALLTHCVARSTGDMGWWDLTKTALVEVLPPRSFSPLVKRALVGITFS